MVASQIGLSIASLQLRESLRDQSIRDALTGLFNRRFMLESLERELLRSKRKQRPLAVLFIDLDHFKKFNDSYGHEAGDLVLRRIADVFRHFFRQDDIICRYGGEEFAIILPESNAADAGERGDALRREVSQLKLQYNQQLLSGVTLSVGVAAFPEHGDAADALLKAADHALYQSKAMGRDRVTISALTLEKAAQAT